MAINTFKSNAPSPAKLLKTVAIYGANASGKTNFLRAVQTMKSIVLESATKWQRGDVSHAYRVRSHNAHVKVRPQ